MTAPAGTARYRQLDSARIVETLRALVSRVSERFPGSGLSGVAAEMLAVAERTADEVRSLSRPIWPLRVLSGLLSLAIVSAIVLAFRRVEPAGETISFPELVQTIESAMQEAVFVGIAIAFIATIEGRLKRRRALQAIHELRSFIHIVDMHQLTKDPEQFLTANIDTESSPRRTMTRHQLGRYLDYCGEMLSLASKLAALYAQHVADPVVLDTVAEVESLAGDLSAKIWHKIMILDTIAGRAAEDVGSAATEAGA